MKQHDETFKSEVTTTVIQEPSVFVSQAEQRQVPPPISVVSEKVRPPPPPPTPGHPDAENDATG